MRWFALALLCVGCGKIENDRDYADARARAECKRLSRCDRGYFEDEFRDLDDCTGELADIHEEENDAFDDNDCDYVPEEAAACVNRIGGMSCRDWGEGRAGEACDLVWDCTSNP